MLINVFANFQSLLKSNSGQPFSVVNNLYLTIMKPNNIYFLLPVFMLFSVILSGQDRSYFFIGIQPTVTKEKFYEKNAFDINIVPFVFQVPISKRMDFRVVSLCNYHFGDDKQISDVGMNMILPVFLKQKEERIEASKGIYLGPVLGLGRNFLNKHNTVTAAIESGYLFSTWGRFALGLALQYGKSFFKYDDSPNKWRSHFGVKVNLGFWI